MPTSPNEDARRAERDRLIEYQAHANDAYDQTLFKLSGGALGLSFVFVRQFVADGQEAHMLWALGLAWFLWIVSLMCVLWSFYASGLAYDEAVRQHDQTIVLVADRGVQNATFDGGWYDVATRRLNAVGGITFAIGAALAGLFMISNLGGLPMRDSESDSTTTTTSSPETRPLSERVEERGRVMYRPQPAQTQITGSGGGTGSGSSGTGSGSGRSSQQR